MSDGFAAGRVTLVDHAGDVMPAALLPLEHELWDGDRRRLTVLLDPARIKRGLVAHRGLPVLRNRSTQQSRPSPPGRRGALSVSRSGLRRGLTGRRRAAGVEVYVGAEVESSPRGRRGGSSCFPTAGTFRVAGTRAEEMYAPEVNGRA